MLNFKQAYDKVQDSVNGKITGAVRYHNLYVFRIMDDNDPLEGEMDPFYSVDTLTGIVAEFSVLTDANILEFTDLMVNNNLIK